MPAAVATADPATQWAKDVEEGRVVAGRLTRLACERHLRDVREASARGLYWRPELAAHALGFFPAVLSVTAGAKEGEPFNLPSYTAFVAGSLFGWVRESGIWRYRKAWLELGKGQIKSPLMAAIGLYIMGFLEIMRAEVYALAKDRNQANVLFMDAVSMCKAAIPGTRTEDGPGLSLEDRGDVVIRGTGQMAWMIEHPASASKFRSLAGDVVSGPRPRAVLCDEIHEWKSNGQIENWQAAIAKMPGNALMILGTNTPAADQVVGTEYSEHYQRLLRGEIAEDDAFALIARVDEKDDPLNDESCWPKALPCLGLTYPIENVRGEVNEAKHRIAKALSVKRLYFGIPVGTSEYWIDLDAWTAVQGKVDLGAMAGRRCVMALDLSQKNDLTALGIAWDVDGVMHATVRYWKPQVGLDEATRGDAAPYVEWAADPRELLYLVPGRAIEYEFVAASARDFAASFAAECLAFDPAHISEFRKAADRIRFDTWIFIPEEQESGSGLKMVIHGQGRLGMNSKKALWMPRSLQQLEDRILAGKIVIDESPVTTWCAGNAAVEADAQNNRFLIKKRSRGRIDGLVVLAMLAGALEADDGEGSVYEERGLLII